MRGVIVAAGLGMRMRPLTDLQPKCMLPIGGKPLIEATKSNMRAAGCDEIVVIVGHMRDAVSIPDVTFVENTEYQHNNILHSLMMARSYLDGPVICSYSDIWVEPENYTTLVETDGDIVATVDSDWREYYAGRSDHPLNEAENVHYDASGRCQLFGKGLSEPKDGNLNNGEFLGLWRMSANGCMRMVETFEKIDARLAPDEPFQNAQAWRVAYITDMFQELTNQDYRIDGAFVERGWAELDTLQDFERLGSIAERQRLRTLHSMMTENL